MRFFRELKNMDYLLLAVTFFLLISGWFIMYSASYQETIQTGINYPQKQLIWIGIAMIVFLVTLFVDYHFFLKTSFIIYSLIVILLLAVLIFGERRFGARRWIGLGGFSIQPSELAKLAVILGVAKYLVMDIENRQTFKYILFCGIILIFPLILIFKQPDLGTTLVFLPTVLIMLFVAGIRKRYVFGMLLLGVSILPFALNFLKEYQKKRLFVFLNPESDPMGAGYSLIQSKIAIGSGGLLGKGWLSGTQNRLNFLPERHTDFIFSVIGEEWGFIGAVLILLAFFIVIAAGFNIVKKAPDISGRVLAIGLISLFGVQVCINIGMTIGLVPVTGIPLPFISCGGTSLIVTMAMMGLLQNIYMRRFMF